LIKNEIFKEKNSNRIKRKWLWIYLCKK
jgi:hypothetical protein